jgi:hypothetical protein
VDDACAGGAVAAEDALFVRLGDRVLVLVDRDADSARDVADERVRCFDAAVEDADADAAAGRSADRPLAVDAGGERVVDRDAFGGVERQRPGGKLVVVGGLVERESCLRSDPR